MLPTLPIKRWSAPFFGGLLACVICLYFYDQFWWPPDDGAYAFIADQLLNGKILHKEVQDLHMGYINLLNAGCLALFGNNFLSLRYPLIIITIIQSSVICYLLKASHPMIIFASGLAISSLTFIQFINPTANWYALFLAVLLITVLQSRTLFQNQGLRLIIAGFVIGNLFLFRQLSAVFAGIACISYLHHEYEQNNKATPHTNAIISKSILFTSFIGTVLYLTLKVNLTGILLFGIFPVIVLLHQTLNTSVPNKVITHQITHLSIGFLLSLIPIITYHASQNSILEWTEDTLITANALTHLKFFTNASYIELLIESFKNIFSHSARLTLNGMYWSLLLLAPSYYGFTLYKLIKDGSQKIQPIAYIPLFFCLVSVHYEIQIYLYYSISLILIAVITIQKERKSIATATAISIFLSISSLQFHAAQPLSRGPQGVIQGDTVGYKEKCSMERCEVYSSPKTIEKYKNIIAEINRYSELSDYILAIPFNPEIYYLSQRNPPVSFYNTAFGISSENDVLNTKNKVLELKTKLLIVKENDKYYTEYSEDLVQKLITRFYTEVATVDEFTFYLKRDEM